LHVLTCTEALKWLFQLQHLKIDSVILHFLFIFVINYIIVAAGLFDAGFSC